MGNLTIESGSGAASLIGVRASKMFYMKGMKQMSKQLYGDLQKSHMRELRPIMLAMHFGMSRNQLLKQFGGLIQWFAPEIYFHWNNTAGFNEGAD